MLQAIKKPRSFSGGASVQIMRSFDYARTAPEPPEACFGFGGAFGRVVNMARTYAAEFAPVNGFWLMRDCGLVIRPVPRRRLEDDLLEVVATDDDDREIQPAAFAHQPAADRLARRRLLGDANGIRQAVPDRAERSEVAAILGSSSARGRAASPPIELAGRGVDGVPPDPVVVKGLYPVDRRHRRRRRS